MDSISWNPFDMMPQFTINAIDLWHCVCAKASHSMYQIIIVVNSHLNVIDQNTFRPLIGNLSRDGEIENYLSAGENISFFFCSKSVEWMASVAIIHFDKMLNCIFKNRIELNKYAQSSFGLCFTIISLLCKCLNTNHSILCVCFSMWQRFPIYVTAAGLGNRCWCEFKWTSYEKWKELRERERETDISDCYVKQTNAMQHHKILSHVCKIDISVYRHLKNS